MEEEIEDILQNTVNKLCKPDSYKDVFHGTLNNVPMPSILALKEIVELLRETIFPGYFGNHSVKKENLSYYIGVNIDKIYRLLSEQIKRGICFEMCDIKKHNNSCTECDKIAESKSQIFISKIPLIRHLLTTDVHATFNGDPAAKNYGEIIYCYPGIKALTNYRIAHELLKLDISLIPRMITELAHSETGIDIHPGASIGEFFAIDHGTGVVIGETSVIGKNVKIYQGVTLGAKSFPLDEQGNPIKGVPRHPIIEDNVVIYSEATILGRITIGKGSIVGGNIWVTNDLAPNSKITQSTPK
ncbi:MAG: serine acetyltransferase [Bacteroidetes bacterium GWE2_29_8]|nr:MAG: serine acetyltransferase [Bacteroidetes bacterium GWE2_29_8]OFY17390.1 MAG: serine acetyltransferase [Bacteroidetes bacterium GWF2_29_10]